MTDVAGERSTLSKFLLRNFVIFNPMFLFSAALVLGGAWLVHPPQADGGRSAPLLLQLFGAIQLYQLTLIGAAALLWRRGDLSRDVRNLALVVSPFLLDVTFTSSSFAVTLLTQSGPQAAVGVATLAAALALVEARLLAAMVGVRFDRAAWAALLGGPVIVAFTPLLGAALAIGGDAATVGRLSGLLVAGLVLTFGALAGPEGSRDALRRLSPLALGAALVHACATTWTYSGSLDHVIGLTLIAAGAVLPRLGWPRHRDLVTPFVLPVIGAAVWSLPDGSWAGYSDLQLGVVAASAVHAGWFLRTRSLHFLAGGVVALHLSLGGTTLGTSLELALALALFGYAVWRQAHPALIGAPLLVAAGLVIALHPSGAQARAIDLVLACQVVGAGLLVATHRQHGRAEAGAPARALGAMFCYVPAFAVAIYHGEASGRAAAQGLGIGASAALLVLAGATRLRGYALPSLFVLLQGALLAAPSTSRGWGALGLVAAFASVGAGVAVSLRREQLLAWLERGPRSASEERPRVPLSPSALGRPALLAVALAGGSWLLLSDASLATRRVEAKKQSARPVARSVADGLAPGSGR